MDAQAMYQWISDNIPGGLHCIEVGADFPFRFVSESFLRLLGCTQQDVAEKYHGNFPGAVYAPDRENTVKSLRAQLAMGADDLELQFRFRRPDGRIVWLLDRLRVARESACVLLYGIVMDVTASTQAVEELRVSEERHRIILEQTQDIIFEWDAFRDRMSFSPNWRGKFGRQPPECEVVETVTRDGTVHPDDAPRFLALMNRIRTGAEYGQEEVRMRDGAGRYFWCRIRLSSLGGEERMGRAVGVIVDIDKARCAQEQLLQKSQLDPLTGLLNKATVQSRAEALLAERPDRMHAMLILDVDNFKTINDSLGHLFGDAVLTGLASQLGEAFRETDVVGRIGGDEFLVLMCDIPNKAAAAGKAGRLLAAISSAAVQSLPQPLGISIGVAVYPEHGRDYIELFRCADAALYDAKRHGKNKFRLFSPAALAGECAPPEERRITDMERRSVQGESLTARVFRILYESRDVRAALPVILEMVGRTCRIGRVTVCERDGESFEWCAPGAAPCPLWTADFEFDENGLFYGREGVHSVLRCAMLDDGRRRGWVGFDECAGKRVWTQQEIDALQLTSEVISTFLLKYRMQQRLCGLEKGMAVYE